jgi:hypothetical protein
MEEIDKKQKIVNRLLIIMFIFWIPWIISSILWSLESDKSSINPIISMVGVISFIIALILGFIAWVIKYSRC